MQNPKFIEIDNLYYSGLIVVNYYREQTDILLKTLIETNINMNISIFYEKQNSYKTIKDLTYHIGNVGVELKDKNQNREAVYFPFLVELNSLAQKEIDAQEKREHTCLWIEKEDLKRVQLFDNHRKMLECALEMIEKEQSGKNPQLRK